MSLRRRLSLSAAFTLVLCAASGAMADTAMTGFTPASATA